MDKLIELATNPAVYVPIAALAFFGLRAFVRWTKTKKDDALLDRVEPRVKSWLSRMGFGGGA